MYRRIAATCSFVWIFAGLLSDGAVRARENGLARTPPMGWNSWNKFGGNINETLIKEIADAMVASGMRDAGYVYLNIDDCWMARQRDAQGNLVPDPKKFPGGMKALGEYIHKRGLKFGIYQSPNVKTCAGYPGSKGYEQQDIRLFVSWEVDYLKYDHCGHMGESPYRLMGELIAKTGRPIVYSANPGNYYDGNNYAYFLWAPDVLNLWRTTTDIKAHWAKTWKDFGISVIEIVDKQAGLEPYAGPGHWNDPDMLEVGNLATADENRSHFSMWAILAAPLICGNDLRKMPDEVREILTNKEVIAVDQDPAGRQGWKVAGDRGQEVWMRPLADGSRAVVLLNRTEKPAPVTVHWADIGLKPGHAAIRDLWAKSERGQCQDSYTAESVPPHGCVMLKVRGTPVEYDYVSDLPWSLKANGKGIAEKDMSNGGALHRDGRMLTIEGKKYKKGIGVCANSDLRIDLGGQYKRFISFIGIDDEVGNGGSVVFQVWLDGAKAFDSGPMTGSTPTKKVDLSVEGKKELRLVASDGGDGALNDHADWAEAVLYTNDGPVAAPTITPADGYLYGPLQVKIACTTPGADIRYTTDGAEPAPDSSPYTAPLTIRGPLTIKARAYKSGADPSSLASTSYLAARDPENPDKTVAGLAYAYYEGNWKRLPDFKSLRPATTGAIPNVTLSARNRGQADYGFVFTGYVEVPANGVYTFFTNSDDGSQLHIGDKLVVDNDGVHSTAERSGSLGLKAGKHAVRVTYFDNGGGGSLTVGYAGPGIEKQPIPSAALFRVNTDNVPKDGR